MSAKEHIIPIFVPHIGCPHRCVFCNQEHISGSVKPATTEDVKRAVGHALELQLQPPFQLAFYGGSFTAIPAQEQERLLSAVQPYIESNIISSVRLSTRPDAIDEHTLARLRKYHVSTIELGAQSMDDAVLRLSGRGHTAADVASASSMIKANGFKLVLQMMTGLPGDTLAKTVETAKKLIALRPDAVRIYPTVVVRDTALFRNWKNGSYHEHTIGEAVEYCAAVLPLFSAAGIPVIRLGLNPTEDLSGGDAVAGAYHPALGELVMSRVMLNRVIEMLNMESPCKELRIHVHPSKVSQMTGQNRCNIEALRRLYSLKDVRVIPDANLLPDEILKEPEA